MVDAEYYQLRKQLEDNGHYYTLGEKLSQFFPKTNFLDVGCGLGHLTNHLMNRGHSVLGIDNSEWAIEHSKCSGVQLSSFQQIDRQFETVIANELFCSLPDADLIQFAKWSKNIASERLIIFNTTEFREDDFKRNSDDIKEIFLSNGWFEDELTSWKLRQEVNWDFLIFLKEASSALQKARLTQNSNLLSLVVDCWGLNHLSQFYDNIVQWQIPEVEVLLLNWNRISLEDYIHKGKFHNTDIEVFELPFQDRSRSRTLQEGLKHINGAAVCFLAADSQLTSNFFLSSLNIFLNQPQISFVVPSNHLVTSSLKGQINLDCISPSLLFAFQSKLRKSFRLLDRTVSHSTWDLKLSTVASSLIPSIFCMKLEQIQASFCDVNQSIFAAEDLLIQAVYKGFQGFRSSEILSCSVQENPERFAESEIQGARKRLILRSR
jgi:SAM-dependent methyltransferase